MADRVMLADNKPITDEVIARHIEEAGFLFGQPKVDGMRVYIGDECIPQSRSGKEWKNKPLRSWAQAHPSLRGLDGEVIPGHVYYDGVFREAMSGTRKAEGSREFTYFLFDYVSASQGSSIQPYQLPYWDRYTCLQDFVELVGEFQESDNYHARLVVTPTTNLHSAEEVRAFEEKCIAEGWEGAMLRRPDRAYKFGRSTNRGGELIKLKRYEDAEAVVVGWEAWEENQNEATQSPLGYQVRSAHKEGKIPIERLGAWKVQLLTDRSVEFSVGVMRGVTHADRDRMWQEKENYAGRIFKFSHQGYSGGYDKPRQPVFLNWRSASEF